MPLDLWGVAGSPVSLSVRWRQCYLTHLLLGLLETHEAVGMSPVSWNELGGGGREVRPRARKARPDRDKGEEEALDLSQWKVLM